MCKNIFAWYNKLMSKIRRLYYFDKKNAKEMITFLNNGDNYTNRIMFNPLLPLHSLLPLKYKFLPESYVLKEKDVIKGLITVAPTKLPLKQMEIQKLLFEENCYDDAGELIQFVVSKYKARGTASFIVRIDDCLPDLVRLFVSKCGFSQISYEKLWEYSDQNEQNTQQTRYDKRMFRSFRNSDASVVANLYNDFLLPHFRPLLSKDKKEFKEPMFKGLSYFNEYKYVMEDKKYKNIAAYISIQTTDNENYILDFITATWADIDITPIIEFAKDKIQKRQKHFKLYIKTKKYTQLGENIEQELLSKNYNCIQNQMILTNSSARIIKNTEGERKFTVLNQFYGGIGVINRVNREWKTD